MKFRPFVVINSVCFGIILGFGLTYALHRNPLDGDFPAFYLAGKAVNEGANLYDNERHHRQLHELNSTVAQGELLPYLYPPWFALLFAPLAYLPPVAALVTWGICSLLLYTSGLRIAADDRWLGVLPVALAFPPFLFENLIGGQVACFGFFAYALAINFERNGAEYAEGFALALLTYKPTLLLLILPLLFIRRAWRVLVGFCVGCALLGSVSLLLVGVEGCVAYVNQLLAYRSGIVEGSLRPPVEKFLNLGKYTILFAPIILFIGRKNFKLSDLIPWTLALNIYTPIYDTVLMVFPALDVLRNPYRRGILLVVALFIVPYFTQPLARVTGFHVFTLVLLAFGIYIAVNRSRERHHKVEADITV